MSLCRSVPGDIRLFVAGTSPSDGARLVGALLTVLERRQCLSIFATHLHSELKGLPLDLPNTALKRLRVQHVPGSDSRGPVAEASWENANGGSVEPTYLLEDGMCTDSLAIVTCRRQGVPEELLEVALLHTTTAFVTSQE